MDFWEILLIGIGLSMDAMAVTLCNTMAYRDTRKRRLAFMPLYFGGFQALMPVLGYLLGSLFAGFISKWSGIVVFLVLGFIGGKMIYEAIRGMKSCEEEAPASPVLTHKLLLTQAVATSIDAFAVGITIAAAGASIVQSAAIIGVTTALCTVIALVLGRFFGKMLGNKAEILGGVILLIIAIKALFP